MQHFDLAIVGSGSGNSLVTPEVDGWQIAIVEAGTFGGTCLNVGCIPTKMYVYAADVAETIRRSSHYGVDGVIEKVRWSSIRDRVFGRIDPIAAGGREYRLAGLNTTLFEAEARFTGPRQLTLSSGERLTADQIVIATGSRAMVPDEVRDSGVPFYTSDDIMRIDELPRRLAILGGGFIAAEFAHVFSAFGTEVTLVARTGPLVRHLDHELANRFTALASRRWDVRLDAHLRSATHDGEQVRLELDDGSVVHADALLVATGRIPNGDRLDLAAAGVDAEDDGLVMVDDYQRTSAAGVWALGDASSRYQLKHVANHEARVVAHNLAHPEELLASDHRFVPSAVFTDPQLASVGLTEHDARAQGLDIVTAHQDYGGTAYGWAMEDTSGFCKIIADRHTGQLVGAHLMGPQASTLIQPLIQAMSFGLTAQGLARGQYWIHPALSEVVENALLKVHIR